MVFLGYTAVFGFRYLRKQRQNEREMQRDLIYSPKENLILATKLTTSIDFHTSVKATFILIARAKSLIGIVQTLTSSSVQFTLVVYAPTLRLEIVLGLLHMYTL